LRKKERRKLVYPTLPVKIVPLIVLDRFVHEAEPASVSGRESGLVQAKLPEDLQPFAPNVPLFRNFLRARYRHFRRRFTSQCPFMRLQAVLSVQELPERLHLFPLTHAVLSDERKFHVDFLIPRTHFETARQAGVTSFMTSFPLPDTMRMSFI